MAKTSPFNAGGTGSIPGWGAEISHASPGQKNQNIKSKIVTNSTDFKNDSRKKKKSLKKGTILIKCSALPHPGFGTGLPWSGCSGA